MLPKKDSLAVQTKTKPSRNPSDFNFQYDCVLVNSQIDLRYSLDQKDFIRGPDFLP